MRPELSEVEILLIKNKLTELELSYLPLKDEFLDHICCQIETEIAKGHTFDQAVNVIFGAITIDELKELQQQTILFTNQKSRRMKNLMFLFSISLIIFSGSFFFLKQEEQHLAIQLPSPEIITELSEDSFLNKGRFKICNSHFSIEKEKADSEIKPNLPPDISPLKSDYKVSSEFGMRKHTLTKTKKFHRGIDFIAPIGTPILATSNGIVIKVKKNIKGYGHHIIIKHDQQFSTLYAHLNEIKVAEGAEVLKGDIIGTVGTTGSSTQPHLHYEVIKEGKRVNPMAYCNS